MSEFPKVRTVMLVDDELTDQMLYKRVIKRSGLIENVISFTYPDKALEYLKIPNREQIDVLFLDINMPRLNGFEFLDRAIAEVGPKFAKMVVVMLTTSLNPEDEIRAKSFEVVKEFLNKPLTVGALEHVVALREVSDWGRTKN